MQKSRCLGAGGSLRPSTNGQCSDRRWLELDSFARIEDAGCPKNWWGHHSLDTRTAFADEGDQTERWGRPVWGHR